MGARIEIPNSFLRNTDNMVAPLVGARIEITLNIWILALLRVAPLVGARIEITVAFVISPRAMSLPSWERGLKFVISGAETEAPGRSPRGSED